MTHAMNNERTNEQRLQRTFYITREQRFSTTVRRWREGEGERVRKREREKREKRKEDTTRRKPVINNVCVCMCVCVHGKKSERYVLYERDTAKATKKVGRWSVS